MIDFIEFIKDTTRFLSEAQYLKNIDSMDWLHKHRLE